MYGSSRRLSRRRFLRQAGTSAAMIPLVNLVGCSDGSPEADGDPAEEAPSPPPAAPADSADPADSPEPADGADSNGGQAAQNGTMPRLEESDPTAQALGYRHDAADVDTASYPRLQPGQTCSNCALYLSDQGSEEGWGGCSIFPGKLVNAEGWCSAYVPA